MSQLSRIEQELLTLSPANFQKPGDAYLARFRGWRIQSWGTMIGADKDRTGVPDSWAQLSDGRFVFLAYTTAHQDLPNKLQTSRIASPAPSPIFSPLKLSASALYSTAAVHPQPPPTFISKPNQPVTS